jgi:hypothetical protein
MSHYFKTLQAEILERSKSKEWEKAALEWDVTGMYEEADGTCTCGYTPIVQHNVLCNRYTREKLVVGRVCVRRFLPDTETEQLWQALDRIKNKPDTSVPAVLIDAAEQRSWCDETECAFLRSIRRKRNISPKQKAWRNRLTRRILYQALWKD